MCACVLCGGSMACALPLLQFLPILFSLHFFSFYLRFCHPALFACAHFPEQHIHCASATYIHHKRRAEYSSPTTTSTTKNFPCHFIFLFSYLFFASLLSHYSLRVPFFAWLLFSIFPFFTCWFLHENKWVRTTKIVNEKCSAVFLRFPVALTSMYMEKAKRIT